MDILHLTEGQPPQRLDKLVALPADGIVWVDFVRDTASSWDCWAEPFVGVPIDPQHVQDSLNAEHVSFFDGTPDYDMLLFQGLAPYEDRDLPFPVQTRTAAFFMFDRLLITVRAPDNISVVAAKKKLEEGRARAPTSVLMLAHVVLDTMVDRYLKVREPLDKYFTALQDELLGDKGDLCDWRSLLVGRREARKLETLCQDQQEAIDGWRRGTRHEWSTPEEVRIRDLSEHVNRVLAHATNLERDSEAAVQLHFASTTHRTNEIMKVFTVVSVVFMPMMLITSIWGMNFEFMPELHERWGYPAALGLMVLVGAICWLYFKRRGFL